jgi:hypothetical protein
MICIAALVLAGTPVSVDFRALKARVKPGEQVLFTAMVKNNTASKILLVKQGDSMHSGRKAPLIQIEVRSLRGTWAAPSAPTDCGNTNYIRAEDFVAVKPGASVDVLAGMRWSTYEVNQGFLVPGAYEARLVIDTTAPLERWLGGPRPTEEIAPAAAAVRPYWERVPKFRLVSRPVRVTVAAE